MLTLLLGQVISFGINPIMDEKMDAAAVKSMSTALNDEGIDITPFLGMTLDDFLEMTPKQYRELTGEKLGVKHSLALKVAQRKVKKELGAGGPPKNQAVAFILGFFLGYLGIHRFYLGYTFIGILQLLTLGCCGVWVLIDLIRIGFGDLGPADGSSYDPPF